MRFCFIFCHLLICLRLQAQQTIAILGSADSLLLDNQTEKAIDIITRAEATVANNKDKLLLLLKKSEALIANRQYEKASELLQTITKQNPTGLILAQFKSTEGILALYQGRNDLAEEYLLEAVNYFEQGNAANSLEMAKALNALGLVYYNSGKVTQAEEQLLMALGIRVKLLPENHELIAASYNDLGLVYSRSDPDKALGYYEKALPIYETLHGKIHSKIAINNTNTGVIYQNLELYGDAINNLETALATWEKLSAQPNPRKAFVFHQLGYTYQLMRNNENAEIYYKRALEEYTKSHGDKHPDIASELNAIGNLEVTKKNFDQALTYFHKALQSNLKNFSSNELSAVPKAVDYYNGNTLLYSLMFKAKAYEAKHFGKTLRFSDLELALTNLIVCDTLIDKLRQQSNNEADKISLGAVATDVYADGVRIAAHMNDVAIKNKKYYSEKAFYFAEKSKSAVLLEAISDVSAKSFAGIPQDLLEEEKSLKSAIALCAQKLSQKPSVEEENYLRESIFTLNRHYQTFTETLEKQYPEYYNLKFNTATPTIADLQKLVDTKTALLSYFIDEDNSHLYIFEIDKRKLAITSHQLSKEFDKYLTGFRNSIYYQEEKTLRKVGNTLYKLLIPKLNSSIEQLVIFPTGRLGVIPFEALLTKDIKESNKPLPYLVQNYSVRYEFSASLALQKSGSEKVPKPSILLCAPITFSEKDNLVDLPGTEQEVNSIAALFKKTEISQTTFTFAEANEHAIKSDKLKEYNLLHFATHGVVDETNPELSRIFLQTSSEAEDGYLFSGEIYNLQLKADLVTLSACQTGLGKISKGEGVIGLSRALVYAGAKNIIVSYWSVADQSTAELMTNFYSEVLINQASFPEALRKVKLDMLKNTTYSAPYYWAPFVLIGF